jgi:hypothetical protein
MRRVLAWVEVLSLRRAFWQKPSIGAVRKFVLEVVSGCRAHRCLGRTMRNDRGGHRAHDFSCHCPIFGTSRRSDGDRDLYDSGC